MLRSIVRHVLKDIDCKAMKIMANSKDYDDEDENPWLKAVTDSDVFVMYNTEDEYEISKYIFSIFDTNNVGYVSPAEHIMPGYRTYSAIEQAVKACKKMLLILSRESIEKFSFSLETLLALEKSLQTNKLSLIILLKDGLQESDVPKLPFLKYASHVILQNNLHEKCIEKVINVIRDDVTMDAVLPTGNLAAGMAWSHFTGYLEIVLPDLAQAIKKSDWFNDNPGHMPVCLFMLLPKSGRSTGRLGDDDPNVEEVGEISILINNRQYGPKVCKVTEKDKNGQIKSEYYCVAQYPGAFCALGTIHQEIISGIPKEQRDAEVERFKHYLGEILNHEKYKHHGMHTRMIMYDDEEKSESATISHQLRKGITEEIKNKLGEIVEDPMQQNTTGSFGNDVCLLYHPDDKNIAFKVKDFFDQNKIRYSMARPSVARSKSGNIIKGDSLSEIERRIRDARWVLLFVTETTVKDDNMINMLLAELLSIGIEDNLLKVIPILKGISPAELPSFIRWAMHISIEDEDYLDLILNAIKGRDITMKSQIPVGNVAYGLAWSFFVNYLKHVLPDLCERIDNCMKHESKIRKYREQSRRNLIISQQLWEIIPKSCRYQPKLSDVDPEICGPWKVADIVRPLHGTRRVFPCNLWRISNRDTDYYFAGEYLTPVKTLYNMHISMIAGLSYEQMMSQRKDLTDQLSGILKTAAKHEQYGEKCGIIEFDDTDSKKLSEVIIDHINKETGHRMDHENFLRYLSKDDQLQNEA